MNKTEKRQFDLRNKLIAAVAMLLVSCIMMVSTTYAWFTLSTAPEVQGITTTVGANGNLEIALSPSSGNAGDVDSAMGDATKNWDVKNYTWGNLLKLDGISHYGLDEVKLLPAQLNFTGTTKADAAVGTNPLSTPIYGADGRPQALDSNTVIGSKYTFANGEYTLANGFAVNNNKGVRVVGTSDSLTEWEITFNGAIASLASAVSAAKGAAEGSLNNHGTVLAGIMINYGIGTTTEATVMSASDLAEIQAIVNELESANEQLATAIKAAILAEASSTLGYNQDRYEAAKALTDIASVTAYITSYGEDTHTYTKAAATLCATITGKLTSASVIDTYVTAGTATFGDIKNNVLVNIMNVSSVTVNGMTAEQIKTEQGQNDLAASVLTDGINIILGSGSGVYADFGATLGNLQANVVLPHCTIKGTEINKPGTDASKLIRADMVTNSEVQASGYMPAVRTVLAGAGAYKGDGNASTSSVISVPYAYIIDFMFRTNASNSQLKLQTSDAQRVYSDSTSSATQGMGSEMTFEVTDKLNLTATLNLMRSIRIVFMDTDGLGIFGIAKLDVANAVKKDAAGTVIAEGDTDTEVKTITANVNLYEYSVVTIQGETEDDPDTYELRLGDMISEDLATLCPLNANEAKKVSAMVYLDGNSVTNADVANGDVSLNGKLNLQFASTANLVPMENTALKDMVADDEFKATLNVNGMPVGETVTVKKGTDYSVNIKDKATGYTINSVAVTIDGTTYADAYDADSGLLTIPGDAITGDIVVNVTATAAGSGV